MEVLSPSLEEFAFRQYYDDVLWNIPNPILFAEALSQEGIIGSETKDRITSNEDDNPKRLLLDSVQDALHQSTSKKQFLMKTRRAMGNSGGCVDSFDLMDNFVDRLTASEYNIVPFKNLSWRKR